MSTYELQEDQSLNVLEISVSYLVTVKDEIEEIKKLIPHLLKYKRPQDEIVVLWDNRGDYNVLNYLEDQLPNIKLCSDEFNNHFADWKNKGTSLCNSNFIFQVDADEIPNEGIMKMIHWLIDSNKEVDVFLVPRENFVTGITQEHIQKWGWYKDEFDRINYPDYQWRIYRNDGSIKWINKVHERLDGFKNYSLLPQVREYGLNHTKSIQKQEKQNNYYNTLG